MASSERWMCDGIPKNGKKYPGKGGSHGPYENDLPYCADCGLPRESSIPKVLTPQPTPKSKYMPMKDINILPGKRGAGTSQFSDKNPQHFMNKKLIKKLLWLPSKICTFIKR